MIPRSVMLSSPLTTPFIEEHHVNVWMGANVSLVAYPIAKGEQYNLVLGVPRSESMPKDIFNVNGDVAEMRRLYAETLMVTTGQV
ncbi:hypothetical protein LPUS_08988 [Lasallia pustulata]|uniref:Uncharacterized protein n=1 Tax=Lasallia pustulata TaxID=136370 RepID=A0A1W5D6C7_9LECA|nr:hypothetical protein LPUS_08988 [Lasallia pustulata]